jgi:hypothetical protein
MPIAHRRNAEWTPERFRRWGASVGPHTEGLITAILASRPQGDRTVRQNTGGNREDKHRSLKKARSNPGLFKKKG